MKNLQYLTTTVKNNGNYTNNEICIEARCTVFLLQTNTDCVVNKHLHQRKERSSLP